MARPFSTLDGYFAGEILRPFAAGLALFFVVATSGQMLRASDAVTGLGLSSADFCRALLFATPPLLGLLMPITGLFATLWVTSRLHADRELWVLAQTGTGPLRLLRTPVALGACFALVAVVALVWGEPWGVRGLRQLFATSAQRALSQGVRGGHFHTWLPGMIFLAEGRDAKTGRLEGVVLADRRNATRPTVISARHGELLPAHRPEELIFVLEDGVVLLGQDKAVSGGAHLLQFKRGQWRLDVGHLIGNRARSLSASQELSLGELYQRSRDPAAKPAERALWTVVLHRKFAVPMAAIVFAILAVPLGLGAQGAARSRSFLLCLILVVGYYYIGRALELLARSGRFSAVLAAWAPNLIALVAASMLWWPHVRGHLARAVKR